MSIKIIDCDITKAPAGTLICHQVNCQGVMGAGVALAIARKWPKVKDEYITRLQWQRDIGRESRDSLGGVLFTPVDKDNNKWVACMFAQDEYGRDKRHTDYTAFYECIEEIELECGSFSQIAFPYRIGCGLGGGNWNIIRTMIEEVLGGRDVVFYRYGEW